VCEKAQARRKRVKSAKSVLFFADLSKIDRLARTVPAVVTRFTFIFTPMEEILIASIAALIAGFVDAIAGGGGIITIPTLLFLNLPIVQLLGTNKLVSTVGTSVAAVTFIKKKKVTSELLRIAFPAAFIGGGLGAFFASTIPTAILKPAIAVVIILLAFYFFFRPQMGLTSRYQGASTRLFFLVGFTTFLMGSYDGLAGPGTGAFLMFLFIRVVGLDFVFAAGNTKVVNLASNLSSVIYFLSIGEVNFHFAIPMAMASILGNYAGVHFAIRRGASWIRWIFIVMALAVALKVFLY
jgi:uncharacterized membrane protein YfcA